jgi:hypothetical protein
VIAEPLAVIARHRDDRGRLGAGGMQPDEQPRDLRIDERDLAVVGVAIRLLEERLRRIVGRVRIVEVDPRKERLRRRLGGRQPRKRGLGDDVAAPLGLEAGVARRIAGHAIVVRIEAARQAEPAIQHIGADEGARAVAGVVEGARERRPHLHHVAVQAHAVRRRQRAGENRRMRRQRERRGAARLCKADPTRRKRIDRRRQAAPHAIGAKRVDRDEEDVGLARGRGRRAAARRQQQAQATDAETMHTPSVPAPGGRWKTDSRAADSYHDAADDTEAADKDNQLRIRFPRDPCDPRPS